MAILDLFENQDMPHNWKKISLAEFRKKNSETIEPAKFAEEIFELYSVPSLETGKPEIVKGNEIGSNKQVVHARDVLLSKINPRLNRSWLVQNFTSHPAIASTEWIVFERNPAILSDFLRYFLTQVLIRDFLAHNASGVGGSLTRVKPAVVDGISFGLPPLAEQQRIVTKIEELFSELDKGVENLRTAQQQLKVYRQALLKHAFEGKLTADWRAQNPGKLESADALLARIQQEREARYQQQLQGWEANGRPGSRPKTPKELPPLTAEELAKLPELPAGWGWFNLAQLLSEDLCNGKSVKDRVDGFPVLRLHALNNGSIDLSFTKQGDWSEEEARPYFVKENDFLVSRGNGSKHLVGRGGFAHYSTTTANHVAFPDTMIRVRVCQENIDRLYFGYCWDSSLVRNQIEKSARTTAGIYKINQGLMERFLIPIPCIEEQTLISSLLSEKLSLIDQLEQTITHSLQQADALRQSILRKAFSGQLVPQDPNDEPASVLLERIRAERAAQPTARGRKAKASA
ncbi:restriction endonuclease subunit S [Pseudomonas berkeleyensis]|uniref:Restriction endonuclease subunit S n=1 Tax=Pseudomonas berkeleyensis TaxID=2726956 RepID=A0A7G5DN89_9PSED|nr:restriction endonuclease subunit S [Pseudomonas berkeleyensis]QMV63214.1 restriction endonuclease subunit S [Pseudomonas berkeleyensis]WSO38670.1 restriction endonuclease subunit S [Pseudomonas berkeleyensis]